MKSTPVRGMKDVLPDEMVIREYLMSVIKEVYRNFGYTSIETPALENIENLSSKQGGDNEKLIFKILKRGEKLDLATATDEDDLVDTGLRYDLTVPLSRYYSNNSDKLPSPFKALQIGSVWRADRPQKGRFRQFTQCDIDILGDAGILAEIDLLIATTTCLKRIGFNDFTVHIGDRRILKAMVQAAGFPMDRADIVFIILDKLDKIGLQGVREELLAESFDETSVDNYLAFFANGATASCASQFLADKLDGLLAEEIANLDSIIATVRAASDVKLVFDASLVRGMGYYTGTIFEITTSQFGGAIGGGGRYDEMIGKFMKAPTPACGFSIGFERIVTILQDEGFVPALQSGVAYLVDKGVTAAEIANIVVEANALRSEGKRVLVVQRKKNTRLQKETLTHEGYTEFKEIFNHID